jgi:hypothetical protein
MSAFRREARHIIARDLPHISHPDNIIRVWTHRVSRLRTVFFIWLPRVKLDPSGEVGPWGEVAPRGWSWTPRV